MKTKIIILTMLFAMQGIAQTTMQKGYIESQKTIYEDGKEILITREVTDVYPQELDSIEGRLYLTTDTTITKVHRIVESHTDFPIRMTVNIVANSYKNGEKIKTQEYPKAEKWDWHIISFLAVMIAYAFAVVRKHGQEYRAFNLTSMKHIRLCQAIVLAFIIVVLRTGHEIEHFNLILVPIILMMMVLVLGIAIKGVKKFVNIFVGAVITVSVLSMIAIADGNTDEVCCILTSTNINYLILYCVIICIIAALALESQRLFIERKRKNRDGNTEMKVTGYPNAGGG